jgi:hypothetical protein
VIELDARIDRLVVRGAGVAPERLARLQPRIERAIEAVLASPAWPLPAGDVGAERVELPPLGERALADEDELVRAIARALASALRAEASG